MKKILFLLILSISIQLHAQYNSSAPWMKELQNNSSKKKFTLQEISNAFDAYWEINKVDKDKKGSGYKPFKRWESRMSLSLDKDGYVLTSDKIWEAWEEKKELALKNTTDASNWQNVGPFTQDSKNGNGRVNVVAVDPNNDSTIYVGAPAGGIWKSTNAGTSWIPLSDDLPQIGVSGIAIDPNNSSVIYIATGDDDHYDTYSIGVMKSTDGGSTWNTTGLQFSGYAASNEIYINPSNSNMLWVATRNGVYKTIDAGINWSLNLTGNIIDLKIKPGDPNTIYAVTSNRFYKSTNAGDSFTQITNGVPTFSNRLAIEVTPANSSVVYLLSADSGNSFQGIYKSIDSGSTFTQTTETDDVFGSSQAWYDMSLTVSETDENMVFVGVLDIWKSTDGGDDFIKINSWWNETATYTHADIHFLRYFNGNLFCGSDGGVYKSTDDGGTFNELNDGLAISQFYRIANASQSSTKIAGGLQDNGGFGYNGTTWNRYHGGDGMDCAIDPNNQNKYYGFTQNGRGLTVTHNAGGFGNTIIDYYSATKQGNWVTPLVMNSDGDLYAGYSTLCKLVGSDWQEISGAVFGGNLNHVEIDPNNVDLIFVVRNGNLYKSTDKGVTFTNVYSTSSISSVEINNDDSSIVYLTTSGNVKKSIDGGNTFTSITGSIPNSDSINIIKHQPSSTANDLYVGTSLGVYHINDDMTNWEVYSTGLPNVPVSDLEINITDTKLIAGTYGRSVWETPLAFASTASVNSETLEEIRVFPNPSKGNFTITRSFNTNLDVEVFDITGKVLFNLKNITDTDYTLPLNSFNKGVYFLKLESNNQSLIKKIIIN